MEYGIWNMENGIIILIIIIIVTRFRQLASLRRASSWTEDVVTKLMAPFSQGGEVIVAEGFFTGTCRHYFFGVSDELRRFISRCVALRAPLNLLLEWRTPQLNSLFQTIAVFVFVAVFIPCYVQL